MYIYIYIPLVIVRKLSAWKKLSVLKTVSSILPGFPHRLIFSTQAFRRFLSSPSISRQYMLYILLDVTRERSKKSYMIINSKQLRNAKQSNYDKHSQ